MAVAALAEAVEALRVLSADEFSGGLGLMAAGRGRKKETAA
jgi:hypothetical protein